MSASRNGSKVAPLRRTISSSVLEVVYWFGEVLAIAADISRPSLAISRSVQHRSIAIFDRPVACVLALFTHSTLVRSAKKAIGTLFNIRHVYRPSRQTPDSHLGLSLLAHRCKEKSHV